MKTTIDINPKAADGGAARPTMKAVRIHHYGGPEALRYEDVPRPQPGAGEVLIRIHAAGVNPVDWKIREGYFWKRHAAVHAAAHPGLGCLRGGGENRPRSLAAQRR